MNAYYITFRSVTFAQQAQALLERSGLSCVLQRTPRWMEERGCGYCLRLGQSAPNRAIQLLQQNQLPFRKLYRRLENGSMEDVAL